ncbi:MAG TPA: S53 family peptidase [Trebonia sp.]
MRFRHVMAALVPVGAASALVVLPAGVSAAVAGPHAPAVQAGRATPAIVNPLAYKYVGKSSQKKSGSFLFSCQEPGAALNCYTPQELAKAYDIPSKLTGAGETIVIIDAFGDTTVSQDLGVEDTTFGLPAANLNVLYPDGQPVIDPTNADQVGWSGEIALDVESAHAVAPAATIDLVVAKSDQDADLESALKYTVTHHLGSVISQSYGEAESCEDPSIIKTEHLLFAKAAADGVSVFAASGDNGAAQPTCDGSSFIKSASIPASDPLVTGVGATSLTASQPDGNYESETAWNDAEGSSGGGYSTLFKRPFYQNGFVKSRYRGVPDVAYSGAVNNGLLIAWSQDNLANLGSIYLFGGTSAGSPQWAAITALADQAGHKRLGQLNPYLYLIARTPLYNYVFHDITTGNNSVSLVDASNNPVNIAGYNAGKGWDPVTGLGTPDVAHLIAILH